MERDPVETADVCLKQFGSMSTGLAIDSSDVDLAIEDLKELFDEKRAMWALSG